jgi:radical SAM protein with 4Fe4S-binding SPASM domain
MTKKGNNWVDINGRTYLREVLPLDVPISIVVEPIEACNFKCIYCRNSLDKPVGKKVPILSLNLFEKLINDFKQFPQKTKSLTFCGTGESLLNKDLPQMISLAKEIANETVLITNGSLLTNETSKKIVDAGLDIIKISLQGLNAEDYLEVCDFKLDFDKFVSNIEFLYKNKKQCKVYIKAPSIVTETEEQKELFSNTFENICDGISIQAISPLYKEVDYTNIKTNYKKTIFTEEFPKIINICPKPFYFIQILADGSVVPCCSTGENYCKIGNINNESIFDIWHGNKLQQMRMVQINGQRFKFPACKDCTLPQYLYNKYDDIDDIAEKLKEIYE